MSALTGEPLHLIIMSQVYLRDLKDSVRSDIENEIRRKRPDLIKVLEKGEDIAVGEYLVASEYELV